MDALIQGYRRFRHDQWPRLQARYEALAEGQAPETLIIACSDSRADPATVFDAAPGELFVVRNVAALVPPYNADGDLHGTSAALEFGVRVLKVKRIVVMGHARCGGVGALLHGAPELARDFVEPWMQIARPALTRCAAAHPGDDDQAACEREVVRVSLDNLRSFPWIERAEAEGRLKLVGARFDVATGVLAVLDDASDEFHEVSA